MLEDEEVHAFVVWFTVGRVNLVLELRIHVDFKSVCYPAWSLCFDEALLEDQWSVPFHVPCSPLFLSLLIHNDVQLFNWLDIWTIEFDVHLDDVSCLLCDYVIELPSKVFTWEAKVLRENHMSQDVLPEVSFDPILVVSG